MAAYLGDTDSDDEIPSGWEERVDDDGRVYFACHDTETTQWTHPTTGKRKIVPKDLPFGWTRKLRDDGVAVFYEESRSKETTTDPRLAFSREPKDSLFDFRQNYDGSTTAMAILNGVNLTDKVALITGCNTGIGFETARSLALHGCEVIFACRSMKSSEEAIQRILKERPQAKLDFLELDLCSLSSVRNCANAVRLKYSAIDFLILNAGVLSPPFALTEDNYEQTFQTNHLAQFYLTLLLKPVITNRSSSRIIVLSSESHRMSLLKVKNITQDYLSPRTSKSFVPFMAYNDSKLCNVLFALELSRRWSIHGVTVNAVHPGNMVATEVGRHWWFYRMLFSIFRPFTKSVQQAAATTIWAATAPELEGVSGQYMNNCWLSPPNEASMDADLAKQLWDISVDMVKTVTGSEVPD